MDKLKKEQELYDEESNFIQLQQRVERLAVIVEEQALEIEGWKQKYVEASENEQAITMSDQKHLIE